MYPDISPLFRKKRSLLVLIPFVAFGVAIFASITGSLPRGVFGYVHEAGLACVGGGIFVLGFGAWRKKRLIENTPTSKIRSVAMGLGEICGLARVKSPLKSPITMADCVYYHYKIEEERRDSKGHRHWATTSEGFSTNYFYVEDATGRILVDPLDCEAILTEDYRNIDGTYPRRRYTEWYIMPGDYVYVLGTVKKFRNYVQEHRDKLVERLRALKADKAQLMAFDANGDGQISQDEWDAARAKVEQELLAEELRGSPDAGDDIVIAKCDPGGESTFILADRDEKEVAGRLGWIGGGLTVAGFALAGLMLASLLSRAGILPVAVAIPWEAFYR